LTRLVIDASVAIKWVVSERGSLEAIRLAAAELIAPELICAECANILWKKVRRGELTAAAAQAAAAVLEQSGIELRTMRAAIGDALRTAISLDHPAYDSLYLALAAAEGCPFVTADETLVRRLRQSAVSGLPEVLGIADAAARLRP
jgi:predicted nucleic acid-binding protein